MVGQLALKTAGVEAVKTFNRCFNDQNAPYGLLDFFSGGSPPPAS